MPAFVGFVDLLILVHGYEQDNICWHQQHFADTNRSLLTPIVVSPTRLWVEYKEVENFRGMLTLCRNTTLISVFRRGVTWFLLVGLKVSLSSDTSCGLTNYLPSTDQSTNRTFWYATERLTERPTR